MTFWQRSIELQLDSARKKSSKVFKRHFSFIWNWLRCKQESLSLGTNLTSFFVAYIMTQYIQQKSMEEISLFKQKEFWDNCCKNCFSIEVGKISFIKLFWHISDSGYGAVDLRERDWRHSFLSWLNYLEITGNTPILTVTVLTTQEMIESLWIP